MKVFHKNLSFGILFNMTEKCFSCSFVRRSLKQTQALNSLIMDPEIQKFRTKRLFAKVAS